MCPVIQCRTHIICYRLQFLRNYANARMSNFEVRNAGQQTDLGRYPIHFHLAGDKVASADVPYIRSVSIHNTFARCITIRGTNGVQVLVLIIFLNEN